MRRTKPRPTGEAAEALHALPNGAGLLRPAIWPSSSTNYDEARRANEDARAEAAAPRDNPIGELAKQQQEAEASRRDGSERRSRGRFWLRPRGRGGEGGGAGRRPVRMWPESCRRRKKPEKQAAQERTSASRQTGTDARRRQRPRRKRRRRSNRGETEEITRKLETVLPKTPPPSGPSKTPGRKICKGRPVRTDARPEQAGPTVRSAHKGRECRRPNRPSTPAGKPKEPCNKPNSWLTRATSRRRTSRNSKRLRLWNRPRSKSRRRPDPTKRRPTRAGQPVQEAAGCDGAGEERHAAAQPQNAQASMNQAADACAGGAASGEASGQTGTDRRIGRSRSHGRRPARRQPIRP